MESRVTIVVKHAMVVLAGIALAALGAVLPGIPHDWVIGWAALALGATVLLGVVDLVGGERPRVAGLHPTALMPPIGAAAAAGYLLSWLSGSPVPLAVAGGVVAGVGIEGVVALAVGRASRDPDTSPPPRVEQEASDAVVHGWMALGALDIVVLAAAAGGRVSWTLVLVVAAASGFAAPAIWAVGERVAR